MQKFKLIFTLLVSYNLCSVQGQQSCETIQGGPGRCISLDDCNPLMDLLEKPNQSPHDIDTIRRSHICGFQEKPPRVCCPEAVPPPQLSSNACFTPDAKEGKCINLHSCPHLVNALTSPVSQETITFMRNSRCNGPDHYSICCGPPRDFNGSTPQTLTQSLSSNPNPSPNQMCSLAAAPPDPRSRCCGVQSFNGDRIIPGESTSLDQYPWLAIIDYIKNDTTKLLCGGTLISGKYVLTAAHCVTGKILTLGTPSNIRLGEYDISNDVKSQDCILELGGTDCTDGVELIPIEETIPHPNYNPKLKRNDIALIRMRHLAPYTDFIRPICLPRTDILLESPPSDLKFNVAGWGVVDTHSNSYIKQHVDVPGVPTNQCQAADKSSVALWSGQICAGDSCKSDSGGPLMYENERTFEVVGVVSFGPTPCGIEDIPGVYTKVYEYITWIRSEIKP